MRRVQIALGVQGCDVGVDDLCHDDLLLKYLVSLNPLIFDQRELFRFATVTTGNSGVSLALVAVIDGGKKNFSLVRKKMRLHGSGTIICAGQMHVGVGARGVSCWEKEHIHA